jgi:transglutaminase-like putative cysteine protease
VLQVAPAYRGSLRLTEHLGLVNDGVPLVAEEWPGSDGGRQHVVQARQGLLSVAYEATTAYDPEPALEVVTVAQRVEALRPSRYCPSDRLAGFARSRFVLPEAAARVRAICEHVWNHVIYAPGTSGPTSDAVDTLVSGQGVCRDFAHLVAALCRAVEVPARVAAVYAPGLWAMDLHVVVETEIDGVWRVWDATRLAPRATMVRIATGRDAADVAFATVLHGQAELTTLFVQAIAAGDLPADDHESLAVLR